MSCPIKANTIKFLKGKKVIGDKRIVTNYSSFMELNDALTKLALNKYDVGNGSEQLFTTTTRHFRDLAGNYNTNIVYEANNELFDVLQEAIDHKEATAAIPIKKDRPYRNLSEVFDENAPEKLVIDEIEEFDNTDKLKYLLFGSKDPNGMFANEVLDNLIKNYNGFDKDMLALVTKAMLLANTSKATIKVVEPYEMANQSLMEYQASTNEIRIAPSNWKGETTEFVVHGMIHEVVHSVTVAAYRNPLTMEQQMFRDFVNESFEFYRGQGVTNEYGMTNPEEFIAEIYSNARFRDRLSIVDSKAKKKVFSRIIDFFRTILGLTKTPRNIKLVRDIVDIARTEQSLEMDSLYDIVQFKKSNGEKVNSEDLKTDLTTLNGKLDSVMVRINSSINTNIKVYEGIVKRSKAEEKVAGLSMYVDNLKNLQAQINDYAKADKLKSVAMFVEQMDSYVKHVEGVLNKVDHDDKAEVLRVAKQYDEALTTYSVIEQIEETLASIKEDRTQDLISAEDLEKLTQDVLEVGSKFGFLRKRMDRLFEKAIHGFLNNIKYFSELETKHRTRLEKEWADNGKIGDKNSWVSKMMNTRDKQLIDDELQQEIKKVINDPVTDIGKTSVLFNTALNSSATLVQIFQQLLVEVKNRRIETERKKDLEFQAMYEKLVADKGTNDIRKLYENLIQFDAEGRAHYIGEHKTEFLDKVVKPLRELRKKRSTVAEKSGINSKEYQDLDAEIKQIEKDNLIEVKGKLEPLAKWKNDLSHLSEVEKEAREFFIKEIEDARKATYGEQSLVRYAYGSKFYELPKISKSGAERAWTGNMSGVVKDTLTDFTTVKADDVGYYEANRDGENNPIMRLRIHYRDSYDNRLPVNEQSLDLMTITRLEFKNGNTYKIRKEVEREMNALVAIAGRKKYYEKHGSRKVVNKDTGKFNIIPGTESNIYKMMNNMMEQQFYDIMHKGGQKFGPVDANKLVSGLSQINSFLALSLSVASGTANVLNANAQMFLESFIKGQFITAGGIAKANKIYGASMKDNMLDLTRPINKSFVNQVNEMFDVRGILNLSEGDFLRTDLMKRGLHTDALQVFQDSGEHWVQSVITMAVLEGIKVMDKDSNFIDKDGNVVDEKQAASLLDMLKFDKDNLVQISDKVVYTTHSKTSTIHDGGKEKIDMLIRKKIYDSVGNYSQDQQSELYRHWLGKLTMLYRKYLVPMGVARLKGITTSYKRKEELEDDELSYSYSLQEYEEGTYTTLVRYMFTAVKDRQFNILSKSNWDKLTDYEKHNIKRASMEIITIMVILPLTTMLGAAMLDDDDELAWFLVYELRRLESELSQYTSIEEFFKIMRSPIPTAKLFQDSLDIFYQAFSPFEEYEGGYNKGRNKLGTKLLKKIPVAKEFRRTYRDLYEFQESMFGL